jgi:2-polyprenyl-3-methyl-5-hydroxy-6-metoxy-1,4-benzoquinol methylase
MEVKPTRDPLLTPWLRNMRFAVAEPHLRGDVLDIGFGSGRLASKLAPQHYYGFDLNPEALPAAKARYPEHTFSNELPEGRRFDCVIALAVIEHTPDPTEFLATCGRFLREGGKVVITTPNPSLEWMHGVAAKLGLLSHEAHDEHQSVVGRRELTAAATKAGLQVDEFRYFMLGANQLLVLSPRKEARAASPS